MKINQKGFVVAIIVLAIAVLLGVGYFVFVNNSETVIEEQSSLPVTTETKTPAPLTTTTTTNETAEWKTYTNTQYGFSVSFPPQTSAIDGKADFVQKFPDAPAINNYESFCDTAADTVVGCFTTHLVDADPLYDLIETKEKNRTKYPEANLTEVTVNGVHGVSGEICERNCVQAFTFQLKNNHRISISFPKKLGELASGAQQVLSTFKQIN